ncbi:hypothetical protein AeNC1_005966 [Aphanomyces euteiches]|nr:hypothetical protein AeNC1_005966 [Aphanomyces euteiches]
MARIREYPMKSSCQARLEARKAQVESLNEEMNSAEQLRALRERLCRAREKRTSQVSCRRSMARERVARAQAIARATKLEEMSRSQGYLTRLQTRMEEAEKRRAKNLEQTAYQCQQQNERVTTALQVLVDRTIEKRRAYDASLRAARHRRATLTSAYMSKLAQRASLVELTKDRIQSTRALAAKTLQRWIRKCNAVRRARLVFGPLRTSAQSVIDLWIKVGQTSFEASMELMQDRKLSARAHTLSKVLCPGLSHRILLMAGMLAHHPRDTMNQGWDAVLQFTAVQVNRALVDLVASWPSNQAFASAWSRWEARCTAYSATFAHWKHQDGERLTADMLNVYAELFTVHKRAELEGEQDIMAKTALQLQQLRKAVTQTLGAAAAKDRLESVEAELSQRLALSSPPKSPPSPPTGNSNPKPDLEMTKSVFANDVLAHELILNPRFQLVRGSDDDLRDPQEKLKRRIEAAFWDHMRKARDREWMVRTFSELFDLMQSALKRPTQRWPCQMTVEQISAMAHSASWNEWQPVLTLLLEAIAANEAPARNDTTHQLLAEVNSMAPPTSEAEWFDRLTSFLHFAYDKMDEMRVDGINAHLAMLAPYLVRHGVEHEAKKFTEKIERGEVILDNTAAWLRREVSKATENDQQAWAALGLAAAVRTILRRGLVSILQEVGGDMPWPETFAMDMQRMRDWRNRLDSIALQASFLALIREVCGSHGVGYGGAVAADFCSKMAVLLRDDGVKMDDLVAQVTHEVTTQLGNRSWSNESRDALAHRVAHVAEPSNAIFGLCSQRALLAVRSVLVDGSPNVPPALQLFATELEAISSEMMQLAKHNEAVHASFYNRLVRDALQSPNSSSK